MNNQKNKRARESLQWKWAKRIEKLKCNRLSLSLSLSLSLIMFVRMFVVQMKLWRGKSWIEIVCTVTTTEVKKIRQGSLVEFVWLEGN